MLLFFLVKSVGSVKVHSLNRFEIRLFVTGSLIPNSMFVAIRVMCSLLVCIQVVLQKLVDSGLILHSLLLNLLPSGFVHIALVILCVLNVWSPCIFSKIVEFVCLHPVVLHKIRLVCIVIKITLSSCCNLVGKTTVFMCQINLFPQAIFFVCKLFHSVMHHLFL